MIAFILYLHLLLLAPLLQDSWPKTEREAFLDNCIVGASDGMGKNEANVYCSCMLDKLMARFSSPQKVLDLSDSQMEILASGCLFETGWGDVEKEVFIESCVGEAASVMGESQANDYCHCMLGRLMNRFPDPAAVSDMDQDLLTRLATECL